MSRLQRFCAAMRAGEIGKLEYNICRGVEIGRQARLRCVWIKLRAGSSPVLGTSS